MKSLLDRLDERLAATTDINVRAETLAERACYMARAGDQLEATNLVQEVRREYGDGRNARVSIRLMLAEGIAAYYGGLGDDADNRILRATELSRALRIADLNALCAAWLGHLEFFRSNYGRSLVLIDEAMSIGDLQDSNLQARIGMVVAHSLMYAGRRDHAQLWYQYTHKHALLIGDRATIGALMHNRSVLALARFRAQQYIEPSGLPSEVLNFVRLEIESSDTYSRATKVQSIMHTSQLAVAWAYMLEREFARALVLLEEVEASIEAGESRRNKTIVSADIALCRAELGSIDFARSFIDSVDLTSIKQCDVDEQIAFIGSCARIREIVGSAQPSLQFVEALASLKQEHLADQGMLQSALESSRTCVSGPPPIPN